MLGGRIVVLSLCLLAATSVSAASVTVQNLRQWRAPDHTRLVFDLTGPLEHRVLVLESPPRIVIDMERAQLDDALPPAEPDNPLLAAVRSGMQDANTLRVVLDLRRAVDPRVFLLPPAGPYGHRLVIDLYPGENGPAVRDGPAPSAPAPKRQAPREIIIAIDAGHGGEDPGAMGRRYRTREKDITLAVSRELAKLVAATPGMRPVMIRDGDYYVGLRERYLKARRKGADVFVSIHADAIPGGHAKGSSVYALSERGATSALAKHLADRENFADLVGGVSLDDKDDQLRRVLMDLSQSKTSQYSLELAEAVLNELRRIGPVHSNRINQAGFMVLKSPDIPSVLIETAFISNPTEEKKLRTHAFQQQLASGILAGIKRYLGRNAPARTVVASGGPSNVNEHVVRKGETLASIARQYNIHVEALRFINNLGERDPPVGVRLRLLDGDT
ncbi:MAG: N-acetylmuramoyl-L-alanine amidase [Pseudomonadota bacterium]|nr:MAG: N-acetylmuramoyl-L-alanine amidase [Pseudomonadota bacterium]